MSAMTLIPTSWNVWRYGRSGAWYASVDDQRIGIFRTRPEACEWLRQAVRARCGLSLAEARPIVALKETR